MWELWSESKCPEEGMIQNLEYESVHIELIRYMKKFLCQKNKTMCYVIRHKKVKLFF
jgi:hypothetical protein